MGVTKYSKKRRKQVRSFARLSKDYLQRHHLCEVRAVRECQYYSDQIEHRAGRQGEELLNEENFLASCASCSRWVTDHPAAAMQRGISISRLQIQ